MKQLGIGELLVKEKLINAGQLQEALEVQRNLKDFKLLGQVCLDMNLVTDAQLDEILDKYNIRILGELMLKDGLLTREQLNVTIALQKKQQHYKPFGEICVDLKYITRKQLNESLDKHKKRIQLGQLLINLGLISEEQFEEAWVEHKKNKANRLGKVLIQL